MPSKYLLIDLDDERTKNLSEILSNNTSKKILNFLAEGEASANKLSISLNLPINTITYNLEKLIKANLIEESKYSWSVKGKKIRIYKLSNKQILISPRKTILNKLKNVVPIVVVSSILTYFVYLFNKTENISYETLKVSRDSAYVASSGEAASQLISQISAISPINPAIWFAFGTIVTITAFLVWWWRRI